MKKLLTGLLLVTALLGQKPIRLTDVRKIYIEKMNNGLDEYLRAAISKKFHDRLTIVLERSEADAIMTAQNMGVQRTQSATVDLMDPKARVVLWSGAAGDRNEKWLGVKHGGEQKVAEHLAGELKKAMEH